MKELLNNLGDAKRYTICITADSTDKSTNYHLLDENNAQDVLDWINEKILQRSVVEKQVWTWDEASEELRRQILVEQYDINVDYDGWHDFVTDAFKETLEKMGFSNIECFFSGFSSQGDGASFTASFKQSVIKDVEEIYAPYRDFAKALNDLNFLGVESISVGRQGYHYFHEHTMYFEWEFDEELEVLIDENEFEYICKQLAKTYYRELNKAYDDLTSDESIIETLKLSQYTFDENGKIA